MKQSEFNKFVDVIQLVGEQYGKKLSEGVIALYWQSLKDFDLPAVQDALGRHLRNTDTGQFMPKIADIIRMMQGSALDSALSAWAKVDKAVRHVGPYETVVFDDPIIHRVIQDMGGWIGFGEKTDDDWPFVAKDFENRYRGFKARGEQIDYVPKLIGISEAHNSKEGHKVAAPVLLGNPEIANRVLLGGSKKPVLQTTKLSEFMEKVPLKLVEKEHA